MTQKANLSDHIEAVWTAWRFQPTKKQMERQYGRIQTLCVTTSRSAVIAALDHLALAQRHRPPEELAQHVEATIAIHAANAAKREAERRERAILEAEERELNAGIDDRLRVFEIAAEQVRAFKKCGFERWGPGKEQRGTALDYAKHLAEKYGHDVGALLDVAREPIEAKPLVKEVPAVEEPEFTPEQIEQAESMLAGIRLSRAAADRHAAARVSAAASSVESSTESPKRVADALPDIKRTTDVGDSLFD